VSPQGKLGGLKANVYLLHGGADTVIPPAESEWLAREVPPGKLRALVISPLITHVELAEKPATGDYWRVLDALRQILHEMEN
jgi:pimeloyl-ACP methyl ester carboxylesterase